MGLRWGLRWLGSPRLLAQWSLWSCCFDHSAGKGWCPPHSPSLWAGWEVRGTDNGLGKWLSGSQGHWCYFTWAQPDSPANLPSGMRSSMTLALWGSLQLAWPMGVITTVGFTAFTRICTGTGRDQQGQQSALGMWAGWWEVPQPSSPCRVPALGPSPWSACPEHPW